MGERSFIDTNILIYAEATDEPARQRAALACLKQLFGTATGVLSTQVLQEYCNIAIKKLQLPAQHVREQLDLLGQFEVVQVTPAIIWAGLDLQQARSLSFFDVIVVATAQTAGCIVLLSEDFNTGEVMDGLRIVNPLGQRLIEKQAQPQGCVGADGACAAYDVADAAGGHIHVGSQLSCGDPQWSLEVFQQNFSRANVVKLLGVHVLGTRMFGIIILFDLLVFQCQPGTVHAQPHSH